ncbi:MAG: TlpA disulfide reductase family protein [Gemmatimonadota bacterium]
MWMRRRWKGLALGAAALVAVSVFVVSDNGSSSAISRQTAPRFAAWTLDSPPQMRSLDDYEGQPILLNVWATWCDPCREEMPSMERLHRDYAPRGLRIVAVSIDDPGNEPLIREFVQQHQLTFDILHDPKSDIMAQYGVIGVPQTFLISRERRIMATRFVADWNSATSRALIDSLMQ